LCSEAWLRFTTDQHFMRQAARSQQSLFTRSVTRALQQREPSVGAVWWHSRRRATRRCDTDFRRVGSVEDELEPARGGSALSGFRRDHAAGGSRVESFVTGGAPEPPRSRFHVPRTANANI
jgi:hypothetical protein